MAEKRKDKSEQGGLDEEMEALQKEIENEVLGSNKEENRQKQMRMDSEIDFLLKKIQEGYSMEPEDDNVDFEEEKSGEGKIAVPDVDVLEGVTTLEEQWKQYLEEPVEENVEEIEDLDSGNQYNRKLTNRAFINKNTNLMIPRANSDIKPKLIKTPIYDLLVEKIDFHSYLIQEYEFRKLLMECRKKLDNR
jgi:hypothetical protein